MYFFRPLNGQINIRSSFTKVGKSSSKCFVL